LIYGCLVANLGGSHGRKNHENRMNRKRADYDFEELFSHNLRCCCGKRRTNYITRITKHEQAN
jgi:hypothetical protein